MSTWTTDLTDQRLIQVEIRGDDTAAVKVQVVVAAQLAVITQGWLTGCLLLLKITAATGSTKTMFSIKKKTKKRKVKYDKLILKLLQTKVSTN